MYDNVNFQTPEPVAAHMASRISQRAPYGNAPKRLILEPTPGAGILKTALESQKAVEKVVTPENDFWEMEHIQRERGLKPYDWVVMNPPFTPMAEGYRYLLACMELSDRILALLPWFILINSTKRMQTIREFGLVTVTNLPRKTFPNCRIQTCLLELSWDHGLSRSNAQTVLTSFNW